MSNMRVSSIKRTKMDNDAVYKKLTFMKVSRLVGLLGESSGMAQGMSWQESPFKVHLEKLHLLINDAIDLIISDEEIKEK